MAKDKARTIWESAEWTRRRSIYANYARWYNGIYLGGNTNSMDRESGDTIKKFPLQINMTRLACDLHKDIARGIPSSGDPLVVRATVENPDKVDAELVEDVINNGVWRPSHGAPIQQEGLLAMNIYGGTAYKLSWEPWDIDLPHGLAVRPIKNPSYVFPIWDPHNPWRAIECYYGFEIDPIIAKAKYGITPRNENIPVLYMEHWTRSEFTITVDGRIPTMKWGEHEWKLSGDNTWGFVPIYYIPHKRTTELFGDSQVEGLTDLEKDINSKMATLSDIVHQARPGMLWGHDIAGSLKVKRILHEGKVVTYVIDVGRTRNVQGGQPPTLGSLPMPDIPESIANFPQDLLEFWMMVARISPAAFGLDDSSSGRITGPVVANRMWTSMAHSSEERINYSEGKTIIDMDILRILSERSASGAFDELGLADPQVTEELLIARIKQSWPPMIPTDRTAKHTEMIERLQQGGVSIEEYLSEMGVADVESEKKRIEEWLTIMAEIEAKAQPDPFGGNSEPGNERSDQKVSGRQGDT